MVPDGVLEERIRSVYSSLSPSHRRLVEYLLEKGSEAAFSTARQLGDALAISESTVVRLAPELGYDGFPALQVEFQKRLLSRMEWRVPMGDAAERMPRDATAVLRRVMQNDAQEIQYTLASLVPESFEQAVQSMLEANTVHVLGLRTSAALALYTSMRLRLVLPKTRLLAPQFGDLPDQLLALEQGDLLVAISFFRYAADTVRALEYARSRGIRTLVVTDYPVSPPARVADIVLLSQSQTFRLFRSLAAPLSLLSALVTAVAVVGKERSDQNIAAAYESIESFDVLLSPWDSEQSHLDMDGNELDTGAVSDDTRLG